MKKYLMGGLIALSSLALEAGVVELRNLSDFSQITRSGNVVVSYYKPGCGFCTRTNNVIPSAARQFPNVTILRVNVAQFPSLKNFSTVPHVRFYKNGATVAAIRDSKGISATNVSAILKRVYG